MDDFKWFIGLLIVVVIMWFGGRTAINKSPASQTAKTPTSASAKVPAVKEKSVTDQIKDAEKEVKRLQAEVAKAEANKDASPLKGKLTISSVTRGTAPGREYVLIQASSANTEPVLITGLTVGSPISGVNQTIPKAWTLPFLNAVGEGENAFLRPGGRAYLVSGRSPLAISSRTPNTTSFQLNVCTGFLSQGTQYAPTLPRECPSALQDVPLNSTSQLSDTCLDFIKKIPRCSVSKPVPENLRYDGDCNVYTSTKINYTQCVTNHKSDTNFYRGEWRMYLGRDTLLWRTRNEIVELRDSTGKIIDTKRY